MELLRVAFVDASGQPVDEVAYDRDCELAFTLRVVAPLRELTFGFGFHTTDFLYLTTHNSEEQIDVSAIEPGDYTVRCRVRRMPLLPGVYSLRFGITAGQAARVVFYAENLLHFRVGGDVPVTVRQGFFALDSRWTEPEPLAAAQSAEIA